MSGQITVFYCDNNDIPIEDIGSNSRLPEPYLSGMIKNKSAGAVQNALWAAASGVLLGAAFDLKEHDTITANEYGKPMLDGRGFSISHSEKYSVLAIGQESIGIDIQKNGTVTPREILRVLPAELIIGEVKYYSEDCLTRIWTVTEAALKAEGTGFYLDPRKHPELFTKWVIESFLYEGHYISIAAGSSFSCKLKQITGKDILCLI